MTRRIPNAQNPLYYEADAETMAEMEQQEYELEQELEYLEGGEPEGFDEEYERWEEQ